MWKYLRRPAAKILLPVGGEKADVWIGVRRICRDVSRGLGAGACGEIWCRKSVDAGPDDRRSG